MKKYKDFISCFNKKELMAERKKGEGQGKYWRRRVLAGKKGRRL